MTGNLGLLGDLGGKTVLRFDDFAAAQAGRADADAFPWPATLACTGRKLMFQRRLVTLWAWLIRFPACGFLPQISHCCAIGLLPNRSDLVRQT